MNKQFNDLYAFMHIAQLGSFSKAAKVLGVQPSALSHRMNDLEARLQVKLLNRTTRAVSTTDAGQRLLAQIAPHFQQIQAGLQDLGDYRNTMAGKIRINAPERPAIEMIYPKVRSFLQEFPDVDVEIFIENRYVDIVAEGFDFGVRFGKDVANDMVAVQISAKNQMAVVASPEYLDRNGTPQTVHELAHHRCIVVVTNPNYRLNEWEFLIDGQIHKIRVPESRIFNQISLLRTAALDGLGIAWSPRSTIENDITSGRLCELFYDSRITYPPMYLYYPKNKHKTQAAEELIERLKWSNKR